MKTETLLFMSDNEKRIDQFAPQTIILPNDKIPFWKTSAGVTSWIDFQDFMNYVMSSIAETGIVAKLPDGNYWLYKPDNTGVWQPQEDLGTVYPVV
jgi:hypothetical protein